MTSRNHLIRALFFALILATIGGMAFAAGIAWSTRAAHAADEKADQKVVYPEKTELDLEGMQIEGQVRNPGEFYFQHRPEEKFDSLVKRRKHFHREMLRDVVLGK